MVDEITSAFLRFRKNALLNRGIVITSLDEGEESDFPLNDTTKIYLANITLGVNAEIYFDYPVPSITGITSITQISANNTNPDQPNYIIQGQNQDIN